MELNFYSMIFLIMANGTVLRKWYLIVPNALFLNGIDVQLGDS